MISDTPDEGGGGSKKSKFLWTSFMDGPLLNQRKPNMNPKINFTQKSSEEKRGEWRGERGEKRRGEGRGE